MLKMLPYRLLSSSEDQSVTATGTIGIKVTDSNDHCPTLTSTHSSLCADKKTVYITALDEDASPNAAPFTFTIDPEGSQGSWDIEVINGKITHELCWSFLLSLCIYANIQGLYPMLTFRPGHMVSKCICGICLRLCKSQR